MSEEGRLVLEVLSGPLDGTTIALEADAEWSRTGEGSLAFPWDVELGEPQARFTLEEKKEEEEERRWWMEGLDAPHGTYRINREERLTGKKVELEGGDILKASQTWLLIRQA